MFRRLSRAVALGVSVLLAGASLAAPAHAATGPSKYVEGTDEAAWLFDPLNINRIDLTIGQDSLLALSADTFTNQVSWEPASAVFSSYKGTLPSMNIGMHLKGGLGSRRAISSCGGAGCSVLTNSKPALKIKFDYGAANANQRLYGLKEITLNSMVQDPSMIHETVDYRLARAAGLPAPRTGFVHVYANGVDLGLHLLVEQYDSSLFKRWFNAGTQSSYEGAYWQDVVASGNAAVQTYTSLQKHMGVPGDGNADLSPIAHVQDTSGSVWWNAMMQLADMGELTRDWAFEHYVQQWDAYSWFIINNYQVHVDKAGIFTMHPWGMDQTLINNAGDYNVHFLSTTTDSSGRAAGTLFVKCLQYTTCKQLYISELAKLGTTADSLNLSAFIDEVWGAISNDVLNDPVYHGTNASRIMLSAKAFVSGRTKNSDYTAAVTTRKVATMTLTYPDQSSFLENKVITPTLTRNTTVTPTYHLMNYSASPVCSVDAATGAITALRPGYCAVSVTTPQGLLVGSDGQPGYHYGYASAIVDLGKLPGTVTINDFSELRYATPQDLTVSSNSTGTVTVTTKGDCRYVAQILTATAAKGNCVLTVTVAKDASHAKATLTKTIPMKKAIEDTTAVSEESGWDPSIRIPKGATLRLVTKPSKVTGSCSFSGSLLKSNGTKGYCKVAIPAWSNATTEFRPANFVVALAPATQSFVQKLATAVSKKKIGLKPYKLASVNEITTDFGFVAWWDVKGNCDFVPDILATEVLMNGSGVCTITLESEPGFKVKGIKRVWTFTK